MKMIYITNTSIKLSLYFICFILFFCDTVSSDVIAVYLPTNRSNKEIRRLFKQDPNYSRHRIIVYSKIKELLKTSKSRKYDYVIAPESFFQFNQSYKKIFTFHREGKGTFKFKIISIQKERTQKNYKDGIIAILDGTKRQDAKTYVSQLLPGHSFKKVKRVSKLEDLFPMLVFNNAQYLMVRPHILDQIRSEYTSPIYVIDDSIEESFPSIGMHISKPLNTLKKPSLPIIQKLGYSSAIEPAKEQK